MQARLREWMHAVVTAVEGANQSSVAALHRRFGDARPHPECRLAFTAVEQKLTKFDGQSELEELRAQGAELTDKQRAFLESSRDEDWKRPDLVPEAGSAAAPLSVYRRRISSFAVARQPGYRRLGHIRLPDASCAGARLVLRCCRRCPRTHGSVISPRTSLAWRRRSLHTSAARVAGNIRPTP